MARSDQDYQRALDYLFARTTGVFKFGLERTFALLESLGNPHLAVPCLHVAGTNGKGSSVATAAALLESRGLRVGTYTSPHLVDFRERIVVGGSMIPAEAVVEFIERYTGRIEELGASFFEATTAMAFDYIAKAGADVSVIEVGLGGRLDSTNVVDPLVAGVRSIARDHTEYLGDTLESIATEKAGIFKAGRAAVVGEMDGALRRQLVAHAHGVSAQPVRVLADELAVGEIEVGRAGTRFSVAAGGETAMVTTPLVGRHQAANTAFAWLMLDAAGPRYSVSLADASVALERVRLPGRFERRGKFIFDVAHNPDGSRVLAETLALVRPDGPVVAVFSVLSDKDWRGMLVVLAPHVDLFIVTVAPTAPANRTWDLGEVVSFAAEHKIAMRVEGDFDVALGEAESAGGTVLVTGSFHTVGDAMVRVAGGRIAD